MILMMCRMFLKQLQNTYYQLLGYIDYFDCNLLIHQLFYPLPLALLLNTQDYMQNLNYYLNQSLCAHLLQLVFLNNNLNANYWL